MTDIIPDKLYKYKKFDLYSLKMLTDGNIYFSDPEDFNDPLDCKPDILVDVDNYSLEALCIKMMAKGSSLEHATQFVPTLRDMSSYIDPEYNIEDFDIEELYKNRLKEQIRRLLHFEMCGKGILPMAESWRCPLMWSHYGDQHKGICFEYDISKSVMSAPAKVDYDGKRCVATSVLIDCYNGLESAIHTVKHTCFFTKATEWKYEREWRFLKDGSGTMSLPFPLSAIYFGMRCDQTIITTIVNLMKSTEVAFFRVYPKDDSFTLERAFFDHEYIQFCRPQSPLAYIFGSQSIP